VLVASYTKCGGSWLTWMLIDILYKPPFYCDLVDKSQLDYFVQKTEKPLDIQPNIHVFRHPLDVVCSAWNYVFLTDRLLGLADNLEPPTEAQFYDNFIEKGSLMFFHENIKYMRAYHYGQWAPIQIKYEDLLENPKGQLKKIIASGDIDGAIKKYSLKNCKAREKEKQNQFHRTTNPDYSFYYKADKFYYKEKMTQEQIDKGHEKFYDVINKHWPETL